MTRARRYVGSGFWVVAFAFALVMAFATLPSPLYGLYRIRDHLFRRNTQEPRHLARMRRENGGRLALRRARDDKIVQSLLDRSR